MTLFNLRSQLLGLGLFVGLTLLFILATGEPSPDEGGRSAADNSYMSGADYIGSAACGVCHSPKYDLWQQTTHTMEVRPVAEAIVIGDFTVQPDLGLDIRLFHPAGTDDFYVDLAGDNHTVDWVLGAGEWKQRYMVELENGTYLLPIQWNTATSEWVGYNTQNWFDDNGDPRREDWGFVQDMPVPKDQSWQQNCAGCHTTGYTPQQNTNGEWTAQVGENLVEYNVGCEACHGPGSLHQNPPAGESRLDYIFYSAESNVCAQCHVRGTSPDGLHGYPTDMYPGDEIWEHFDLAQDVFWGDGKTSKKHHQQYMDWNISGHAAETPSFAKRAPCVNCHTPEGAQEVFSGGWLTEVPREVTWQITCQACHDPHGTVNDHDLLADEETLCITCHNAQDPVPPATPHHSMYEMLTGQGGLGIIGDLRMGGAVTCTDCHMPKTATSAVAYDISSHTFEVLEPARTLEYDMPNSCTSSCHNGEGSGGTLTVASADRVVRSWHTIITAMLEEVGESLDQAELTIEAAQAAGVDPTLVEQAQSLYTIAIFNYDLVDNEGSRGVHNFEYARALLFDGQEKTTRIGELLLVENLPPVARVELVDHTLVTRVGELVELDGTASQDPEGSNLSFAWDLGDGTLASGPLVNHSYQTNGSYIVTLTVTDGEHLSGTVKVSVYVLNRNEEALGELEDKTRAMDETLDEKADRSDLEEKAGTMAVIGVLLLALLATGGAYFSTRQIVEDLREELNLHSEGEHTPAAQGGGPGPTAVDQAPAEGPGEPPVKAEESEPARAKL